MTRFSCSIAYAHVTFLGTADGAYDGGPKVLGPLRKETRDAACCGMNENDMSRPHRKNASHDAPHRESFQERGSRLPVRNAGAFTLQSCGRNSGLWPKGPGWLALRAFERYDDSVLG